MERICDILIVGGGAAGLACAVSAAEVSKKLDITVIDRMKRVGKKISVTGNGRCNLSNVNIAPEYYHGSVNISRLLSEVPDIRPFFERLGLFTYVDEAGRIYPLSNAASSVTDALRFAAVKKGIRLLTDVNCTEISKKDEIFLVKTDKEEIKAKTVVLACGGSAAPVHGSDGSGFLLAKALGLKINPTYPALCYLTADNTKSLEGVRAKCRAELIYNGKPVKTELGEVQFTKNGLSGICIFNLSSELPSKINVGEYSVRLDIAPDFSLGEVRKMLNNALEARSGIEAQDCFNGIFNRAVALYLLKRADIPVSKAAEKITESEINRLAKIAKALEFKINGRGDFSSAQVTAGGVKGDEINEEFMSRKVKGLFLAGEILDIWGDCGGYNLHFAFASGIKAGIEAAKLVTRLEAGNRKERV
ncbi:MAG: aminoacetone oxidase family FAD-binding enzyme [Ruminococcaceae bacterium]|nr:aminoacetone oxidase family FAD-binding enzyme [Oscillospiraceae bacterium]